MQLILIAICLYSSSNISNYKKMLRQYKNTINSVAQRFQANKQILLQFIYNSKYNIKQMKNSQVFKTFSQNYKKWEQMVSKGQLKMKKKINKQKQQYYDFDFSKYQYYYNYPTNHLTFKRPSEQIDYITYFLNECTKSFQQQNIDYNKYINPSYTDIKPYELVQFKHHFINQLKHKIIRLRIKKTLLTHRYHNTNQLNSNSSNFNIQTSIQQIQAEIRSYLMKLPKLQDFNIQFGDDLKERLQKKNSCLKQQKRDELHSTMIQKADLIIYERLIKTNQRLKYNLDIINGTLKIDLNFKKVQLKNQSYYKKSKVICKMRQEQTFQFHKRRQILSAQILKNKPQFFEDFNNIQALQMFLKKFNYMERSSKITQCGYLSIEKYYKQVPYIPNNKQQLILKIKQTCVKNMPSLLIQKMFLHSFEHICYKVQNLSFILFRIISETYDLTFQIHQKDLMSKRNLMKRQLQTIFSDDIQQLLGLQQHQVLYVMSEKSYQIQSLEIPQIQKSEQEIIYLKFMEDYYFSDPYLTSFFSLLHSKSQKLIREQILNYSQHLKPLFGKKNENLLLYYENLHSDAKSHLINIINSKMNKINEEKNALQGQFLFWLQKKNQIDIGMLNACYFLKFVQTIQIKCRMLDTLNAQCAIMYKVRDKIQLLKCRSNIKFTMTKQFFTRYTQTNKRVEDPFDFSKQQTSLNQQIVSKTHFDVIIRNEKGTVTVRRMNPQNPLYEGKRIVYNQAYQQLKQLMSKSCQLGSFIIQKRQNYLPTQQLTYLVDRIQLTNQLMACESQYQLKKLQLMEQYLSIFQMAIQPSGIQNITKSIYKLKKSQFRMNLSNNYFKEQYQLQCQQLQHKKQIIKLLADIQTKLQGQQQIKVQNGIIRKNLSNNLPQISSIYYSQNLNIERSNINQQKQEDQQSSYSEHESQQFLSGLNSARSKMSQSFMSHKSNSKYHLKKTFKQILAKNQTSHIKSQNNKKQLLLNKKKKRILNDTILGNILNFQKPNQHKIYSESIHLIIQYFNLIIQRIQIQTGNKSKQQINQNLLFVKEYLSKYKPQNLRQHQILKQDLLPMTLHQCGKNLSRVCEKIKTSPNVIEEYLCYSPTVLKNIAQNITGHEIDEFRGLYLSLNYIQLMDCFYKGLVRKQRQKVIVKCFKQSFSKFSTLQINENIIFPLQNVLQNQISNDFKLFKSALSNDQTYLLVMGNNFIYTKLIFALDQAVINFYQGLLQNIILQVSKYQQLQNQLILIQSADCWTDPTAKLSSIPQIQNKIFVTKKLAMLKGFQKHILKKQKFIQFFQFVKQNFNKVYQFPHTRLVKTADDLIQNSKLFQVYLQSIHYLVVQCYSFTSYIKYNNQKWNQYKKVSKLISILPYTNQKILIEPYEDRLFSDIFKEYFDISCLGLTNNNQQKKIQDKLKIQYAGIKISMIKKYSLQKKKDIINLLFHKLVKRQSKQFQRNNTQRDCVALYFFKMFDFGHPFRNNNDLMQVIDKDHIQKNDFIRLVKIRMWIEQKMLLFGNSLNKEQLLNFRMLLDSTADNFNIFWKDQTSNLIKSVDLVKIKVNKLQLSLINERYKNQYLSYTNLKQKYKNFLDQINQTNIDMQLQDNLYLLLIANIQSLYKKQTCFQFLYSYGNTIQPPDSLKQFMQKISSADIRTSLKKMFRNQKIYDFNFYKKLLFEKSIGEEKWNDVYQFRQKQKYLRFHLNNLKKKSTPKIDIQLIYCNYKKIVYEKMLQNCNIQLNNLSSQSEFFAKNFADSFFKSQLDLSAKQKQIFNSCQQHGQDKIKFSSIKEEAMTSIYHCKFYQRILVQKMFLIGNQILNEQLDLRKALGDSFNQRQLSLDNKIINQSLNKVLAPKILLNPFLNSPLMLTNYFFAGALKMSYIDAFLNKLKNRAIIIQLAQGGFGYLLKICQLDQVIQSLCKSIISYSQKQFNDRFRTFLQHSEQMKQKIQKLQKQNLHLKTLNKIRHHHQENEIKSIVFQKINHYLISITQKEKNNAVFYKNFQNVSISIAKQFGDKYQQRIHQLEVQNNSLKKTFKQYKQKMSQFSKKSVSISTETLYSDFKKKVQSVLNKQIIKSYDQLQMKNYQDQQVEDSEILLKKLKKQKVLFLLKEQKLKSQYQSKIKKLTNKLGQLSKINIILQQQKYKNKGLMFQVNELQQTCIQIQRLKKQKQEKQEEALMQKFKMIKINQSLQGRIMRYQTNSLNKRLESKQSEDQTFITNKPRPSTEFGMQVNNDNPNKIISLVKKKVYRVKTESYSLSNVQSDQIGLWRQRWQNSQSKYQRLLNKLKIIGQNYMLSKNGKKVGQKVILLLDEQFSNPNLKLMKIQNRN